MLYGLWETALPVGLLILTLIFIWCLNRDKREDPKFNLLISLLSEISERPADHHYRPAA